MRNRTIILLITISLCTAFLSGCASSWRREVPSSPAYEEIENPADEIETDFPETSMDKTDFDETENAEDLEESPDFENEKNQDMQDAEEIVCVKVLANEELVWKTQDDMLAQKLIDLMLHKQEKLNNEKQDDADFLVQIEIANGQENRYYLWGSLQQKNELIIADQENHVWSLSKEDSNHIRSIINGV